MYWQVPSYYGFSNKQTPVAIESILFETEIESRGLKWKCKRLHISVNIFSMTQKMKQNIEQGLKKIITQGKIYYHITQLNWKMTFCPFAVDSV